MADSTEVGVDKQTTQAPVVKGLIVKLCEVGAAISWIPKTGENTFHHYKYATEADLVAALRGELYKRNIFMFPNVISCVRVAVTKDSGKTTAITDLMVRWTFVDGDTGETRECDVPGCGEDPLDKGTYKALTGSEKYMLMKTFLIPTGDDPEQVSDTESRGTKEDQKAVADRKIAEGNARLEAKKAAQQPANSGNGDSDAWEPPDDMPDEPVFEVESGAFPISKLNKPKSGRPLAWVTWNGLEISLWNAGILEDAEKAFAAKKRVIFTYTTASSPRDPNKLIYNARGFEIAPKNLAAE